MSEPVWIQRKRDANERFAALLDDPAASAPREGSEFADELAVVGLLRDLGGEPVLGEDARSRMRTSVLAEAAAESETARDHGGAVAVRSISPAISKRQAKRKASLWAAATAAGIVAFGALGIELAQSALPGDLLYDVKRTTESISLDLTFSDDAKALKLLDHAGTRITELGQLAERDAEDGGATIDELAAYRSVLADLDSTSAAASRAITDYATQTDGGDLRKLREWAHDNGETMRAMRSGIPAPVIGEFDASTGQLEQIEVRSKALLQRFSCQHITSGQVDALGALPAEDGCGAVTEVPDVIVEPRADKKPTGEKNADASDPEASHPAGDGASGQSGSSSDDDDAVRPTYTQQPGVEVPALPEPTDGSGDPDDGSDGDSGGGIDLPSLLPLPTIDLGGISIG